MSDRIKLAEAMGWKTVIDTCDGQEIGISPDEDGSLGSKIMPDPFTDANDDYAVLEWVRSNIDTENPLPIKIGVWDFHVALNSKQLSSYQIGDYARAALKVLP